MKLHNRRIHHFRRQRGVVLFISLIVLVAMTLAGIALVRSVDTANQIAGNLAFKQGATLSADAAIETARNWLLTQTNATLSCTPPTAPCDNTFYYSSTPTIAGAPGTETPWPQYDPDAFGKPWNGGKEINLAADAAGNQVSYVVQRLCLNAGDPSSVPPVNNSCINTAGTSAGSATPQGSSHVAGQPVIAGAVQYFYRVTARITGPRNTVSYVQGIIQI